MASFICFIETLSSVMALFQELFFASCSARGVSNRCRVRLSEPPQATMVGSWESSLLLNRLPSMVMFMSSAGMWVSLSRAYTWNSPPLPKTLLAMLIFCVNHGAVGSTLGRRGSCPANDATRWRLSSWESWMPNFPLLGSSYLWWGKVLGMAEPAADQEHA